MKNCYLLVFIIGTIFFASQTSFAQAKDSNDFLDDIQDITAESYYQYLVGLKKVRISIVSLSKKLKENGVTEDLSLIHI